MSESETKPAAPADSAAPDPVPDPTGMTDELAETLAMTATPAVLEPVTEHQAVEDKAAEKKTSKQLAEQSVADETAEVKPTTPLGQLFAAAKTSTHPEVWGVTLADPASHTPSQIVLQKFLNANDGDIAKAKDQLVKTLEWRAKTKPLELVKKAFSRAKFSGLGYVTLYAAEDGSAKEIFTWNVYGATKNADQTFGNLVEFVEWRVALMELALQELSLWTATKPITANHDPYKIVQVHDYKSVSFLRQSSSIKAASRETIKIFALNYPELLKKKFFVNIPVFMGFMYAFMKLFVAPKTMNKFHRMYDGGALAKELAASKVNGLGELLPAEYGGKGKELRVQGKEPGLADQE